MSVRRIPVWKMITSAKSANAMQALLAQILEPVFNVMQENTRT
jgi:hypothetical protein